MPLREIFNQKRLSANHIMNRVNAGCLRTEEIDVSIALQTEFTSVIQMHSWHKLLAKMPNCPSASDQKA